MTTETNRVREALTTEGQTVPALRRITHPNPAEVAIRVTPDQRERIRQLAQVHGVEACHQVVELLLTGEEKRAKDRARYRLRIMNELNVDNS